MVDDSPTVRKVLGKGLASLGYEVAAASDGVEGLEQLAARHIDLVLTDINMPRLDGFGFVEAIRRDPRYVDLPIIVLTSADDATSMRRALTAGANIFLHKPAPLPKLRYKVESLLREPSASHVPEALSKPPAALLESPEARRARFLTERLRRRTERLDKLSPDSHLDLYLAVENEADEAELLDELTLRPDLATAIVLSKMRTEARAEETLRRLFRLMAVLRREAFVVPLLERYFDYDSLTVRRAMVMAIALCGGAEFAPELRQLYLQETKVTIRLDSEHRKLYSAFEEALAIVSGEE